ncbi:MAG: IS66 family transposase, partial [Thiolinea sp.]
SGYNHYSADKRQICWAHLIRHFLKISARPGQAGAIGKRLLLLGLVIFRTRHRFDKDSEWEPTYRRRMQRLRQSFQATLEKGTALSAVTAKRTLNQCLHLQKAEEMCWTFLKDNRIPLTNNWAESALRPYVIWRKLSFATQSLRGLRFRPMILTLTGTARQFGMSSWDMLREISQQGLERKSITFQFPFDHRLP